MTLSEACQLIIEQALATSAAAAKSTADLREVLTVRTGSCAPDRRRLLVAAERTVETITAADIPWELAPPLPVGTSDDPLVEALVESLAYRALALQALRYAHERAGVAARLEEQRNRLLDQNRQLRQRGGSDR